MEVHINDVVTAGDTVVDIDKFCNDSKVILGPGLRRFEGKIFVTKSGILKQKGKITFWVDCHQKRYIPACGEFIIGIVTNKAGDYFKVDIGANEQASISYLSFEGSTKKHRPDINVGDALYTKVLSANKDMEPELVCVDSHWKKGVTGLLEPSGFIFLCSISLAQKCLNKTHELFNVLGKIIPFEVAVGMNGRIWVKAKKVEHTMALIKTILAIESLDKDDVSKECTKILLQNLSKLE